MACKKMLKKKPDFDEALRVAYCEDKKTMRQIATELKCSPATVLNHLRRCGIETRSLSDYETTDRQREACRKMGQAGKGKKMTDEQKHRLSLAKTGYRLRNDYEFGGHEKLRDDGYIQVYVPDHPNANKDGYVMKHRLVMEKELGIILPKGIVVHHINGKRTDNRVINLAVMKFEAHAALHMKERYERRKLK